MRHTYHLTHGLSGDQTDHPAASAYTFGNCAFHAVNTMLQGRMHPWEKERPVAFFAKRCKLWSNGVWIDDPLWYHAVIIGTKYFSFSLALAGGATNYEIKAL